MVDDPDLINRLSREEQVEFFEMLKSGEISEVIEPWSPWWIPEDNEVDIC